MRLWLVELRLRRTTLKVSTDYVSSVDPGQLADPLHALVRVHHQRVHLCLILLRSSQPFADSRSSSMANRALKEYYERTLTGRFYGSYSLSLAFEDLIRQMVEPSLSRRLPSCYKGLQHPFFSLRPPSVVPPLPMQAGADAEGERSMEIVIEDKRVGSAMSMVEDAAEEKQARTPLAACRPAASAKGVHPSNNNKRQQDIDTSSCKQEEDNCGVATSPSPTKKQKKKAIPTPSSKRKNTEVKVYQDKPADQRPASQASMHKSGKRFYPSS